MSELATKISTFFMEELAKHLIHSTTPNLLRTDPKFVQALINVNRQAHFSHTFRVSLEQECPNFLTVYEAVMLRSIEDRVNGNESDP